MMEIAANLGAGATVNKQDQDKNVVPGDKYDGIIQEKCVGSKSKSFGGFMIDQLLIN